MLSRQFFIALVRFYRWVLSPAMRFLFGTSGACRFTPTCSCYAMSAFERHGAWGGLRLTVRRLAKCHPWGATGYDPVPDPVNRTTEAHSRPPFATEQLRAGEQSSVRATL